MSGARFGRAVAIVLCASLLFSVQRIALLVVGTGWMEWVYEQIVGVIVFSIVARAIWR